MQKKLRSQADGVRWLLRDQLSSPARDGSDPASASRHEHGQTRQGTESRLEERTRRWPALDCPSANTRLLRLPGEPNVPFFHLENVTAQSRQTKPAIEAKPEHADC